MTRYCTECVHSEPMAYDPHTDTFYCMGCEHSTSGTAEKRPLTRRDYSASVRRGRGRVSSRSHVLTAARD